MVKQGVKRSGIFDDLEVFSFKNEHADDPEVDYGKARHMKTIREVDMFAGDEDVEFLVDDDAEMEDNEDGMQRGNKRWSGS
jgi:hypothetical protein